MPKDKKTMFFLSALSLLLGVAFFKTYFYTPISVDGYIFLAQKAVSQGQLEKGLGGKKRLCSRCAMIFMFNGSDRWSFWMEGMEFDLDIIWIKEGKIVAIEKNISASSEEIYDPEVEADMVLEINAGLSDRLKFEIGNRVRIF